LKGTKPIVMIMEGTPPLRGGVPSLLIIIGFVLSINYIVCVAFGLLPYR